MKESRKRCGQVLSKMHFKKCVSLLGKEYRSKESSLKNDFNSFTQTVCTRTVGSNYEVSRAKMRISGLISITEISVVSTIDSCLSVIRF